MNKTVVPTRRIQVTRRPRRRTFAEVDLRTPSGRELPF
jgi:hypothetical protein